MTKAINISKYNNIYFIGIGGIGMSALAKYFVANGKNVAGYDKTASEIISSLEKNNVAIHFTDTIENIPSQYKDKNNTLVIYTPAIPKQHKELNYFLTNNFIVLKRAEILGLITKKTFCFAVAGTHGKTTTSAILGHILKQTNVNATTFLGGIATNYDSNLILGSDKISVVEADEYDRSFLKLSPNIACITSTDADHLDIYGEKNALLKSFKDFANLVDDQLFVTYGMPINGITYGFEEAADYQASKIQIKNGITFFNVKTPKETIQNIPLQLPGNHNILNALVALAMANWYGVSLEKIKNAIASFKGIKRRFNIKINTKDFVLIDDYAHHPTEINAVFQTVSALYPKKIKTIIFQPHLFSRTRDFIEEFATSLAQFDNILLLDIYPARELPIQGVTSNWLAEKILKQNKNILVVKSISQIIENIETKNNVVSMLGAGDIGVMVETVINKLNTKILVK